MSSTYPTISYYDDGHNDSYNQPGSGLGQGQSDKIRQLELEVLRLETKLRDLHTSDTVADKRALNTLQHHVMALKEESQGVAESIASLEVDPFSHKVVEEELGAISATALATYFGDRLLKASRVLEARELRGALWTVGATFVAWRLTFGFWQKFKRKTQKNIEHKQNLNAKYPKLQQRIDVMSDLLPKIQTQS